MIGHFCSVCGNEVDESCAEHPQACIDSIEMAEQACMSCAVVGITEKATQIRHNEYVCDECAEESDQQEAEAQEIRRTAYDERGIRK